MRHPCTKCLKSFETKQDRDTHWDVIHWKDVQWKGEFD